MSYGEYPEPAPQPAPLERLVDALRAGDTSTAVLMDAANAIVRMRSALHRISEDVGAFRGMGGSYRAVDDDPFCVSREVMTVYDAIFPDGWVHGRVQSDKPNYLMPAQT